MFEGLRRCFCNAAIEGPKELGGFGFRNVDDSAVLLYTPPYLRRLLVGDTQVRFPERSVLFSECKRLATPTTTATELLRSPSLFLGHTDKLTPLDLVTAFRGLALVPGLTFHGYIENRHSLAIPDPQRVMLPNLVLEMEEALKLAFREKQRLAWAGMMVQGAPMRALDDELLAPKACQAPWMRNPQHFPTDVRRFMIYAQSNQLNSATNLFQWGLSSSPACRICGDPRETGAHALSNCQPRMPLIKARHDAAHDVLSAALRVRFPAGGGYQHRSDIIPDPSISSSTLRPDETVYLQGTTTDTAYIIDMKCPFPAPGFVDTTHDNNAAHYARLALDYTAKGMPCSVHTVIIPCVGPTPRCTFDTLVDIGFPERSICKLIRAMTSAMAKANYRLGSTFQVPAPQPIPAAH